MIVRLLVALIGLYQRAVSPLFPQSCRFHPSCSQFAVEAIGAHGALRGLGLAVKRVGRCHPWSAGGPDPVPPRGA